MTEEEDDALTVKFLEDSPAPLDDRATVEIPLKVNAWISNGTKETITDNGVENWANPNSKIHVFVHVEYSLKADLFLKCTVPSGTTSKISVIFGEIEKEIEIEGEGETTLIPVASYQIQGKGYLETTLQGLEKSGKIFAVLSHIVIVPQDTNLEAIEFNNSSDPNVIKQFRKGPTIKWSYKIPDDDFEYYYNETRISMGFDPVGSSFISIGFKEGYFGMVVNSETDRKIVFTLTSPEHENETKPVPEEHKVILKAKGKDVTLNCLVGKGIGGQAVFQYNWSPGIVYKFLLRGRPDPEDPKRTLYAAWFAKRNSSQWFFIAEFSRFKTSDYYLTGFYSSLENTFEDNGHKERFVFYGNQWVYSTSNDWLEVTEAVLSVPEVNERLRRDYSGCVVPFYDEREYFSLRSGGFFDGNCENDEELSRKSNEECPDIDFGTLNSSPENDIELRISEIEEADSGVKLLEISAYASAWSTASPDDGVQINENGVENWSHVDSVLHFYFYIRRSLTFSLSVRVKIPDGEDGESKIEVKIQDVVKEIEVKEQEFKDIFIGRFQAIGSGYVQVDLKGLEKSGEYFGEVSHLLVSEEEASSGLIDFIKEGKVSNIDLVKSGPIVELLYTIPKEEVSNEFYYVEMKICEDSDKSGSRFIAIGCNYCQFGLQIVHGDRAVVFKATTASSITDDDDKGEIDLSVLTTHPEASVPEDESSVVLLDFKWSPEEVYQFLIHQFQDPDDSERTKLSAQFAPKGDQEWKLIAEVSVPSRDHCMDRFYSMAVNTNPRNSHKPRKVVFGNQWLKKFEGELEQVNFARLEVRSFENLRKDYDAGVEKFQNDYSEGFYLKFCGFFIGSSEIYNVFSKKEDGVEPEVNFDDFGS